MKIFKVYVGPKEGSNWQLEKDVENLGIKGIGQINKFTVYWITGLTEKELVKLATGVLHNDITQQYFLNNIPRELTKKAVKVETVSNLGVIDPREDSLKKAAADLGVKTQVGVKFGNLYLLYGKVGKKALAVIKERLLMKKIIEHEVAAGEKTFVKVPKYKFKLVKVPILQAGDKKLMELSSRGGLSLNLEEMKAVKNYFYGLSRNPTDIELETIAQTWSEHCSHKSLKGLVIHNGKRIDNLLKSLIIDPSNKLNKKHVVSAFKDNAGGIEIGDKVVCIKVETHNHPSAIEPVGGSETGVGGVIRDILGFGKGAKPISSIVCFGVGPQNISYNELSKGVLHPKAILSGVVAGTKSYGNQMGIPTDFFQDSLIVHEDYVGNPLVYCGTIGVAEKSQAKKTPPKKGDLVFLLGGFTGRDGVQGATFSSSSLHEKSEKISSQAVQIGDAIMEKKVLDAILEIENKRLSTWVTDCGGGGLSSAVGETGADIGVRVNLEKVPKKYDGLSYTEIWISESQERMIVVGKIKNKSKIFAICERHSVPVTVIGEFTGKKRLELYYSGKKVADLSMSFLYGGCPRLERSSFWKEKSFTPQKNLKTDLSSTLLKLLGNPDIASKQVLAHQYDYTVQGATVQGPLIGPKENVHSDVTIRQISPFSKVGVVASISVNPHLTKLNPRKMSHWVIVQSLAKLAACGADIDKAVLLDNFSWAAPSKPEVLGELVESLAGCEEAIRILKVPFISGKDSLNNEYKVGKKEIPIPGTLLITGVAPIKDVSSFTASSFSEKGNLVCLVGSGDGSMGGSYFNRLHSYASDKPAEIDLFYAKELLTKISQATGSGLTQAALAIGKGGLGVALAKMCLGGNLGIKIDLATLSRGSFLNDGRILFSESGLRFVLEVREENFAKIKKYFGDLNFEGVGEITEKDFKIKLSNQSINQDLASIEESYSKVFSKI